MYVYNGVLHDTEGDLVIMTFVLQSAGSIKYNSSRKHYINFVVRTPIRLTCSNNSYILFYFYSFYTENRPR